MKDKLVSDIYNDIKDLPRVGALSIKIADYVRNHKDYNLAQIGALIDEFYGASVGLSIAEEITCLFGTKQKKCHTGKWKVVDWYGLNHQKQYVIKYVEKTPTGIKIDCVMAQEKDLQDVLNLLAYAKNLSVTDIYERKDIDYD